MWRAGPFSGKPYKFASAKTALHTAEVSKSGCRNSGGRELAPPKADAAHLTHRRCFQSALWFSTSYEGGQKQCKLFPMLILYEVTGVGAAISTGLFTSSCPPRTGWAMVWTATRSSSADPPTSAKLKRMELVRTT